MCLLLLVALLAEGVDRNVQIDTQQTGHLVALLAEGVDRNTFYLCKAYDIDVALLAEGVDRNSSMTSPRMTLSSVALLAEGVDRNAFHLFSGLGFSVALLAEGVDRNCSQYEGPLGIRESPSSRRAWIEIGGQVGDLGQPGQSPSSRRAWIEMISFTVMRRRSFVALLAEGVDRNILLSVGVRKERASPS